MKNRLLALLGFILLSTPLAAVAQQFGDFTYTSDGTAVTITGYTGPGGDVAIPDSINGLPVTTIGHHSFYGKSLTSVTIPGNVTLIGDYAFGDCFGLTGVTIPGGITNVGIGPFAACTSLIDITVDAANASYSSSDGVLFNKNQTTLIQCPGGKAGTYAIPDSVGSIGDSAFERCATLGSVTMRSVASIGIYAFGDCTGLTNVTIPDGVTNIGDQAFSPCRSLTSVTIPGSVTSLGNGAFSTDTSLTNVVILNGLTNITGFSYCTSLTRIDIPGSVTSIHAGTFLGCTSLANVTIPRRVTDIGYDAFAFCTSLQGAFFNGNAPSVDSFALEGATNATVYYLPGTTGWGAMFAGRPAVLWNPLMQTSGVGPAGFGFNITGTADIPIVIEAAASLATATWVPLQNLNLTNGAFYFSDPNWTNYPTRFYRIRSP